LKSKIAPEVKSEVLGKIKGGESVASLAKSYGISIKTIYGWLRWETASKVSWMEYSRLKKENQTLKEIVGVLTLELQKSKKKTVN
jgi:transposase-like protein